MTAKGKASLHLTDDRDRVAHQGLAQDASFEVEPVAEPAQAHRTLAGAPGMLKSAALLALQRAVGNRAVQRMLAVKQPSPPTDGLHIMRTVDTMANALFTEKKGQPLSAGDTAVGKLKAHGLTKDDKPAVVAKYAQLAEAGREAARAEATGVVTWAELTSTLNGNSGGQSYYSWKGGAYPHVSVEWSNLDTKPNGPKQIKKIHVSFLHRDGPKYWWTAFSKGVGTYHETSGPKGEFTAGMRDEANEAVKKLIIPLHINPGAIPPSAPG